MIVMNSDRCRIVKDLNRSIHGNITRVKATRALYKTCMCALSEWPSSDHKIWTWKVEKAHVEDCIKDRVFIVSSVLYYIPQSDAEHGVHSRQTDRRIDIQTYTYSYGHIQTHADTYRHRRRQAHAEFADAYRHSYSTRGTGLFKKQLKTFLFLAARLSYILLASRLLYVIIGLLCRALNCS